MLYAVISFDFTDHDLKASFKDLLRDCGALHEKNEYTFGLEEFTRFDFMIKSIREWEEDHEFDYTDYVRIYYPAGNRLIVDDII